MNWNREQLIALGAEYGMPALKALVILIVGWLIAKGVGAALRNLLKRTQWDNRLAHYVMGQKSKDLPIEEGIGKLGYWLVMLLVLMAVFQTLGLTIITQPLNVLVSKITGFLPQLLAAAVLAAVAWAVATVLRIVVTNLLTAFQLDRKVGETAGAVPGETKPLSLAKTLADAVYYLVFLLFLPQILDALQMEGLSPVGDMVGEILIFLPKLFAAVIIFMVFYFVARIVQRLVTNLLISVGFDRVPGKLGISMGSATPAAAGTAGTAGTTSVTTERSASAFVGWVVLVVVLAIGLVQALNTLQMGVVSGLAQELLEGLFKIVIATAIFAVGLFVSNVAYSALTRHGKSTLAFVARAAILIFTGAMALHRADLAPEIVNLAFGALIVGLSLAAGLAFGLGGREAAKEAIEDWKRPRAVPPSSTPPQV